MIKRFAEILSTESEIMTKHGAKFSPDAYDLLEKLLKFDPQSRIGCGGQGALSARRLLGSCAAEGRGLS